MMIDTIGIVITIIDPLIRIAVNGCHLGLEFMLLCNVRFSRHSNVFNPLKRASKSSGMRKSRSII